MTNKQEARAIRSVAKSKHLWAPGGEAEQAPKGRRHRPLLKGKGPDGRGDSSRPRNLKSELKS
jgi:hypothetical protein